MASTTKSRKAKGRRLQQFVRDIILRIFKGRLTEHDVKSTTMGETGLDIQLSSKARKLFPYAVECKNVESINIWKCYEQACHNAQDLEPIVIFKKNRKDPLVALSAKEFFRLVISEKRRKSSNKSGDK